MKFPSTSVIINELFQLQSYSLVHMYAIIVHNVPSCLVLLYMPNKALEDVTASVKHK